MVRDRAAINKVDGAHSYAVNTLGLIPETDAYFDKIEELLGVGEDQTRMPMNTRQGQRQAPQQRMNMGAPARADAPNLRTGRVRGQQVALTSRQREHARDVLGMTDEEYAASWSTRSREAKCWEHGHDGYPRRRRRGPRRRFHGATGRAGFRSEEEVRPGYIDHVERARRRISELRAQYGDLDEGRGRGHVPRSLLCRSASRLDL